LKLVGNIYLCMDGWSNAISVVRNPKYDNSYTGFTGEKIAYLGLDFGGFECHTNLNVLNNILSQLKKEYE